MESQEDTRLAAITRWWGGSCSGNDPDTCYNCTICSDFDDPTLPTTIPRFSITTTKTRGEWSEIADLIPSDRRNGDRFGASVAIDGNQIVVGSPYNRGQLKEAVFRNCICIPAPF